MKTFFRILQYADGLTLKLVQFFLFSFIGIIFSALSLVSVIPMLNVLFDKISDTIAPPVPAFELSSDYAIGLFNHYFITIVNQNGKPQALLFICLGIVASVMLGNRWIEPKQTPPAHLSSRMRPP